MNILRRALQRLRRYQVQFSADGAFYYVCGDHALEVRSWFGVRKETMSDPRVGQGKSLDGWFEGGVTIKRHDTGETYWRRVLPFAFYKVRAGRKETRGGMDELVLDYIAVKP